MQDYVLPSTLVTTPVPGLIHRVGFSGDLLCLAAERPQLVPPLPGVLDTEPSLHVLAAKPTAGKTTFGLLLASAWAQGVPPWPGAPALPGTRSLVISREQSVDRLARMLRRVDPSGEPWPAPWLERLTVCAMSGSWAADHGRDLETSGRLQHLDEQGLDLLRMALDAHRSADDPIGFLVLDSLSRLKPSDIDENSADDMSRWLDAVQEIATSFGVYTLLIHHVGHSARSDTISAARGSSAIGAVAQVLLKLSTGRRQRQRRLAAAGNEIPPSQMVFEVCAAASPAHHIDYFRPVRELEDEVLAAMELGIALSGRGVADAVVAGRPEAAAASGSLRERIGEALKRLEGTGHVRPPRWAVGEGEGGA